MVKTKHRLLYFVFIILIPFLFQAHTYPKIQASKGIRFNFGPAVSFYSINRKHAGRPIQKFSVLLGLKKEWRLDREFRSFFLTGLDYYYHGIGFQSYYFKPDTLKIYDKQFNYNYSLFIHELHLPLQYKYLFKRRDNRLFSSYLQLAYHLRYLLGSDLKITENGNKVKYDSPELKFKNPLFNEKLNAFVSLSYGFQKNSIGSSKGNFFVELNFKYGFSPYSFERDYAASSLYINSSHMTILLGFKL
jgi:hypothetical protein